MSIRIDATQINDEQEKMLQRFFSSSKKPYLADAEGNTIELPEPIFKLLVHVLQEVKKGNALVLMPENEQFTTQAAANFLGVSRQYFVTLLEDGKIPFHRVGTHRRVHLNDLLEYQNHRDKLRKSALDSFYIELDSQDLYNSKE